MSERAAKVATVSARLVAGLVVAGAAVVGVAAAVAVPWPTLAADPTRIDAAPPATDTVLSCAGPLLVAGRDLAQARRLTVAAPASTVVGAVGSSPAVVSNALAAEADGGGVDVYRAAPVGGQAAVFAASSSASVEASDLWGFAAAACQPALTESWLVAGATTTGSAGYVVLANPGDVPATVDLTVYGADGAQTPPGGSGLVVGAGSVRTVALAGLVRNEENPVVRVTAAGAPVRATLQASVTRVLSPGGVEQVGAIALAAPTQVIPGVRIAEVPDAAVATATVRLLAGSQDAVTRVRVLTGDGTTVLTQDVGLRAGIPASVDLSVLPAGDYTVVVDASAGVVAAAWSTTGLGDGADFAWYVAAPAIVGSAQVAIASGPSPTIELANPDTVPATVRIETAGAAPVVVAVPAGSSVATAVQPGAVLRLVTDAAVHASVDYAAAGALSSAAVWPDDVAAPTVAVYP